MVAACRCLVYRVFARAEEGLRPLEGEVVMSALTGTRSATGMRKPSQTAPQPTRAVRQRVPDTPGQHPLWLSALLHLMPNNVFILMMVAALLGDG